ncbi:MAG: DNA polymerase III subunit epsilon [Gallionellales bacterium RIFOXYB12_FULL_54_9]|nr:MAG: DNA polymerase III subunit epsilon [Gallionellales bacterium RIFOXYB12_FULL_54_9]
MNWLTAMLGRQINARHKKALDAWQAIPRATTSPPFNAARYVVVDVETSGLNLWEDRLLSIGAVAVINGRIALGDSFYVELQQPVASSKDNILLHGIGGAAQTSGVPAADALLAFLDFLQKDPLAAFHVTFDQTMIQRAMRQYLSFSFKHPWTDLAYLMPALYPPLASRYRSLDDWINHFGIHNDTRHNALADALVTAQLLQIGMAQANKKNIVNYAGLRDLEKSQRWVNSIN